MKTDAEIRAELHDFVLMLGEWQTNRLIVRLAYTAQINPEMTISQFITDTKVNIESDPRTPRTP